MTINLKTWAYLTWFSACNLLGGCQTPEDEELLNDQDLKLGVSFEDLTELKHDATSDLLPALAGGNDGKKQPKGELIGSRENHLGRLAEVNSLERPLPYEGGVFGLAGTAKVFAASKAALPDASRLYWVMVKVLSEKYSCFIRDKSTHTDRTWVKCRDGRQVVFWRKDAPDWQGFVARQYDHAGFEIVVRKHQIHRVGERRAI